jgi:hypothetical protein
VIDVPPPRSSPECEQAAKPALAKAKAHGAKEVVVVVVVAIHIRNMLGK